MAADDPYADPYASPQVALNVPVPVPQDYGDPGAYTSALAEHKTAFAERDKERKQVEAKQQLNVDQMSTLLEDAAKTIRKNREGRSNLPMMAFGAGMLGTPGDFGTQLGGGVRAMIPQVERQRADEDKTELTLAELGTKAGEIREMPLKTKLDYLKALQVGDQATIRAIEAAQIRAQAQQQAAETRAGGRDVRTADQKEFAQAQSEDPALKNWTIQRWKEWNAQLKAGNHPPAEMQIAKKLMDENPGLTFADALTTAKGNAAEAAASGKARGEAKQAIGGIELNAQQLQTTINKILNHPGLDNYVGGMTSNMPAIPGLQREKALFEALEKQLQGQAFLEAFSSLKGGGAITEIEGVKATQAKLSASRLTNPQAYREALQEYGYWTQMAVRAARQRAGQDPGPAPTKPESITREDRQRETPPTAGAPGSSGSPSPASQTGMPNNASKPGVSPGASMIGQPAEMNGRRVREGATGVDSETQTPVIVKDGKWVPRQGGQ